MPRVKRQVLAVMAIGLVWTATGIAQPISGLFAIRNVTAIPATGAPAQPAMTVLVRGDRIAAVGPAAEVDVPSGTRIVDGSGKFVVPGFVEMHAHLSKTRASALGLFVANGVTTVRDMGGDHEELLRWQSTIAAGTRVGPRILMAGPILESTQNIERMRRDPPSQRVEPFERVRIGIGSPDEARRVVASLASREIDFVKIRTVANRETYLAIISAAHAHGLKVVGHVTGIPPQVVLDAGQDGAEHPFYPTVDAPTREGRIAVWRKFAERGVAIVPTLVTLFESTFPGVARLRAVVDDEAGRLEPRRAFLSKYLVLDWREQVSEGSDQRTTALRKLWEEIGRRDLQEMHAAGMDILAGSDAAVLNIYPGSSLHDEMGLFVREIGMTPAEAIDRATRRSARFLGLDNSIGTVERGKIADLVLLDADPLQDIRNTQTIAAVVLRGTLCDREGLEKLRAAVRNAPDRTTDDWGRK